MSVIKYYVLSQDMLTLLFGLFVILWAIGMIIVHAQLKKRNKSLMAWKILCCVPLVLSIIHFIFYNFKNLWDLNISMYFPIYIGTALMALWQFLGNKKVLYRLTSVLLVVAAVCGSFFNMLNSSQPCKVTNCTYLNYEDCFLKIVDTMQSNYVLNAWKGIDYGQLKAKILPEVQKAQAENDEVAFYEALCKYCYYFYDCHVSISMCSDESVMVYEQVCQNLAGDDHGFAMFTLDDGNTIAVLVDDTSEAYKQGIRFGTVITKWNGQAIDSAVAEVECIYPNMSFSVKTNEDRLKPIFLAGRGGKTPTVTFIDENGKEKTITLSSESNYDKRLNQAVNKFAAFPEFTNIAEVEEYRASNFSTKMLSSDCAYLKINEEAYDSFFDIVCAFTGAYPQVTEMVDNKLGTMNTLGMKKLIIDLRNNGGGSTVMVNAITRLFTKENLFHYSYGEFQNGQYICTEAHDIEADGKWADLDIVVLTNFQCASAGDELTKCLSKCQNVTVMGMTTSWGSSQFAGGMCYTTNGNFALTYPSTLCLDENNEPQVDTNASRMARIELDEQIPVTLESAQIIFESTEDYELNYALNYLNTK